MRGTEIKGDVAGSSPMHFAAMADGQDVDDELPIKDLIDNPIDADPDAPEILVSRECHDTRWARISSQFLELGDDPPLRLSRQPQQSPLGRGLDDETVHGRSSLLRVRSSSSILGA
jgi:hypothetical protein